jgi:hypothetical protein
MSLTDDMTEQQESYDEVKGKTISAVLDRMSIERIRRFTSHWEDLYREQ